MTPFDSGLTHSEPQLQGMRCGLLVLNRRLSESLVITLPDGRTVKVTVTSIADGKVRLGIEADRDVGIWRSELLDRPAESQR